MLYNCHEYVKYYNNSWYDYYLHVHLRYATPFDAVQYPSSLTSSLMLRGSLEQL